MKAMTPLEQTAHTRAVDAVQVALDHLDHLPDWIHVDESLAVARARLQDWLDENEGRWVA